MSPPCWTKKVVDKQIIDTQLRASIITTIHSTSYNDQLSQHHSYTYQGGALQNHEETTVGNGQVDLHPSNARKEE